MTNTKLDSGSISGRHSYSGLASNDLTIHPSDCEIYKYIPRDPNQLHLTGAQKYLQPLQCHLTGGKVCWGTSQKGNKYIGKNTLPFA